MRSPLPQFRLCALIGVSILLLDGPANAQESPKPASSEAPIIPARITQAVDEKNLVVLKGNVHTLARAEYDLGVVADAQPLKRMLMLLQRSSDQEAALRQLLDDQQSKSSSNYHAWLTPDQFGKQFGPAEADIQGVTAWLTSHGFTGIQLGPGRQVIEFNGTAGQVRNAFHTEIHRFGINGKEFTANAADPQIPAALSPVVAGVVSLHNFPRKSHARYLGQFQRPLSASKASPLFTFPNPNTGRTFYGLGPADFAKIYSTQQLWDAGIDGTGQTIAIVGETNFNLQDVQDFRNIFSLPKNDPQVILNGEDPGITSQGEEAEADLDVQWSGAVAKNASIKFVLSASTPASAGVDLSALYIIENNLASVMSESYGDCEQNLLSTGNQFFNSLWKQAAAQGITVVISSGDGGSAGCDNFDTQATATQGLAVSGLASTPYNVSVGGTDFDQINKWSQFWNATNDPFTQLSALSYIPEIPWNENCAQLGLTGCGASAPQGSVNIVAGSGGPSTIYSKPAWQMGVVGMPNDSHRDQPDISLFASPGFTGTGYIYCQQDRNVSGIRACDLTLGNGYFDFHGIGGTSASAPAFAGIMALVNQKQATSANPAPRQGNANYVLYALAKKANSSCVSAANPAAGCTFYDVTKGNSYSGLAPGVGTNSVACAGGSPNCNSAVPATNGVLVDPQKTTTEAWTASAGYDMATGLGSVNAFNLATNWSSVSTVPTTTTLSLTPATGITHGQSENVTVGITVKPNNGTGVPAGDVSLIATPIPPDGTTRGLDQFTLTNGAVTGAKTQSLPGGTYSVSAHYAGDGTDAPSDSTPVSVTVGQEGSQTFIAVPTFDPNTGLTTNLNASTIVYGSSFFIRMYVTNSSSAVGSNGLPTPLCATINALTCPSGTVSLTDSAVPVGQGAFHLNDAGYTRDLAPSVTVFTGGTHQLAASYSGDSSYSNSKATDTLTVTPAPMPLNLSSATNPYVGISYLIQVQGLPNVLGGVAPTGTIAIYDGSTLISGPTAIAGFAGLPDTNPGFGMQMPVTFTSSGDHSVTARYSGDANYAAATSQPQTIRPLYATTTTMNINTTTVQYGDKITVSSIVNTGLKSPVLTGQINFTANFQTVSGVTTTQSTDASGNLILQATFTDTPLQSEWYNASYSGDSNYATSNAVGIYVNVNIPEFTLNIASAPFNITAGQLGTLQISVVPATNNASPVTLSCNGNMPVGYSCSLQPATVNLAGGATSTATLTLSPSFSLAAVPMPNAITSKPVSFFFIPFGSSPLRSFGLLSAVAALLFLCLAWNKRDLRLLSGLGLICVIVLIIGCGGASSSPPPPPPPPPGPFATSTTVSTSSAKVAQNATFTLTAKVTGQGNPTTGNVTFYANGGWIGQSNLTAGTATLNTTLPFAGIYSITAQYVGDANNLTSTSSGVGESVTGSTVMQVNGQTSTLFHAANVMVTIQ
jgi:hypothetical protein